MNDDERAMNTPPLARPTTAQLLRELGL